MKELKIFELLQLLKKSLSIVSTKEKKNLHLLIYRIFFLLFMQVYRYMSSFTFIAKTLFRITNQLKIKYIRNTNIVITISYRSFSWEWNHFVSSFFKIKINLILFMHKIFYVCFFALEICDKFKKFAELIQFLYWGNNILLQLW